MNPETDVAPDSEPTYQELERELALARQGREDWKKLALAQRAVLREIATLPTDGDHSFARRVRGYRAAARRATGWMPGKVLT